MANNFNQQQPIYTGGAPQQQIPIQYPYGTNNLLTNSPYDNYMGRTSQLQIFNQNQYLKCRPVSSKDEARAFQIDLDGSLWVFTDIGNEKIYTKQINTDGTATFKTYSFVQDKDTSLQSSIHEYVTKDEFNKTIQTLMAAMQSGMYAKPAPTTGTSVSKENNTPVLMNFS